MLTMRLATLFLLTVTVLAQQGSVPGTAKHAVPQPKLPVVQEAFCPGNGRVVTNWKIREQGRLVSSWEEGRKVIAELKRGDKVTVLSSITVTRRPDRIEVTRAIPDLSLKQGDIILRYATSGEEDADIWSNGEWHMDYDLGTTTEMDGTGCRAKDVCDSVVIENGTHDWWVRVKTAAGYTGWVLGATMDNGLLRDSGNFQGLCSD